MTAAPLPDRWTDSAAWLPQAIDPHARLMRLVKMDQAAYRSASFLDDRMLGPEVEMRLCSLDQAIADADALTREDARWTFHIGHVGSTLVSRLLGELEGVLALREPRSLRDLVAAGDQDRVGLARSLRRLLSRSFAADEVALVKATSFVSELAPMLVPSGGTALFLFATPRNYIASILAGENSLKELASLYDIRLSRLARRGIDLRGFDASPAHRAAAAWACEMTSLEGAADAMIGCRILWADFDLMLGDMAGWLQQCCRHFGFEASRTSIHLIAAGPLMSRYSKAPEYDYSPALRGDLLAEATERNQADIAAALAALDKAAVTVPLLRRALERAGREN